MIKSKKIRRIASFIMCATMILTISGPMSPVSKVAKAFPAGTTIDEDTYLTENEIKDTVLLSVLRVIANYTKAKLDNDSLPALTGEENLLSEEFSQYNEDSFTFGELKAYTGPINLTQYADKIKSIEGLGYARGASSFDLGACDSITAIPDNEFGKCAMTKIILPNTIETLGYGAFQQSTKLKQVIIAGKSYSDSFDDANDAIADLAGITTIGDFAFDGCNELDNITLNTDTSLTIGTSAFSNCTSLTSIVLPMSNANNIGESAFSGCTSLSEVTFNDSLTYIPSNLFSNTSINKVYLIGKEYTDINYMPSSLAYVGKNAFQQAILSTLDFSKCTKLTYIDEYAFAQASIPSLILPECIESINSFAFNATAIASLYIPDSVTSLGESVFRNSTIMNISISPNVTELKEYSFEDCDLLYNIELRNNDEKPNKLTTIGKYAFKGCSNLQDTNFLLDAVSLTSIGDYAFVKCCDVYSDNKKDIYGNQIYYGLNEVILPDNVTTLGKYVFSDNYAIENVNLGSGVTVVPENAFYISDISDKSSALKSVILSDKLETIEKNAFSRNIHLRTIGYTDGTNVTAIDGTAIFGNSLTSIGNSAFSGCSAKLVYEDNYKINSVHYKVMTDAIHTTRETGDESLLIYTDGATELKEVYINPSDFIINWDDMDVTGTTDIYVIAKHVWISPETDGNGDNTGNNNQTLTSFDILNKYGYNNFITDLDDTTSFNVETLLSAPVSENNTDLYVAYSELLALTKTSESQAGAQVQTIRLYPTLFSGLKNVILPESLADTDEHTALGTAVFGNNISLSTVNMSKNIKIIPADTFNGCASNVYDWKGKNSSIKYTYTGLETINNINNVTDINSKAFYNCFALKLRQSTDGGEISDKLVNIGSNAFYGCKSIKSVVFHSALKTIGSNAFDNCSETDTNGKYTYEDSTGKEVTYKYTEVIAPENANGLGLVDVDFTYATRLESIGNYAFANNAIEIINLPEAAYTTVSESMFAGCQYLNTVTIPNNVTYVAKNAFKDCSSLTKLHIPATAGVSGDILKGYVPYAVSGLQMIVASEDYEQSVPLGRELILPINAFSDENRNGTYTVSVFENNDDATGTVIFENGVSVANDIYDDYLDVAIEYGKTSNSPDKIKLIGGNKAKDDLIVKVQISSAFKPFGDERGAVINAQTFTYNVDVKLIPATAIDVTSATSNVNIITSENAAGDMVESLYISKSMSAIDLSASIYPESTTDECIWTIEDPEIATVTPVTSGSLAASKATITPLKLGNTKLTLKCGTVTKDIYIYIKVPVSKLEAKTQSTTKVSSTSTINDTFSLPVGDTDKITLTKSYSTSRYTAEEWNDYPDTVLFTSDNPEIVSVDSVGNLKANDLGTAVITAKALASNISIIYTITVIPADEYNPANASSISDITGVKDLYTNETNKLEVVLSPVKAENDVKWEIIGGDATISEEGLVTAGNTPGSVSVKATLIDADGTLTKKTKTVSFNVLQASTAVNLTNAVEPETALYVGDSLSLTKTTKNTTKGYNLTPSTSTDSVICTSSNEDIVSVTTSNTKFTLKALSYGSATITLTATSGANTSFIINVNERITGISLPSEITLNVNTSMKLNPVFTPANAVEEITWHSSSKSIVTVSDDGTITGVKQGTALVGVITESGVSATVEVYVKSPAESIRISEKTLNNTQLFVGQSIKLNRTNSDDSQGYILTPTDSSDKVTCKSSDPSVISVSSSNNEITINGVSKGTATLTFTTTSGKSVDFIISTILPVEKIEVPEIINIVKGETFKITPVITPSDSNDILDYSSNNKNIASVSQDGTVTAIENGTTSISIMGLIGGGKTEIIVNVYTPATAVNLTKALTDNQHTINVGSSMTISSTKKDTSKGYNLVPETTTDTITVTSSDDSIATVKSNTNGKYTITGMQKGVATITITASSGVSNSFNVTVINTITELTLPKNISIEKGTTKQLIPNVKPVDHNDTITWSSANDKIATVDSNGNVTAKEKGTVKITATSLANGHTATISVKVIIPCTELTIHTNTNKNTIYLYEGQTTTISTTTAPSGHTDTISYSSLNTTVATVTGSGGTATISAAKKGTSIITVKADSGVSATITVKVVNKKASKKVKISGGNYVAVNDSINLTANLTANTSTDAIIWSSSKTTVATVDSYGRVTGLKKGTADITAKTSSGKTATVTIYVGKKPLPPQKITVSGKKKVNIGKTIKLKYKTRNKVSKKAVTWTSSNTRIATVTSKGKVKGLKKGTVKITVALKTGQKATIKIKVLKKK